MDLGDRWSPTIVRSLLLVVVLVYAPLLIEATHCSEKATVAPNCFIFRRSHNLTGPGMDSTSAQMTLPPASSSISSAIEPSTSSSSSGMASFSSSSQHPITTSSISSSTSISSSSQFSSASLRPPFSSTDILSLAFKASSSSAQSSTSSLSVSSTQSTTTPPKAASPITQPIAVSAATTFVLSDFSAITTSYVSQSPDATSEAAPSSKSSALSSSSFWHKKGAVAAVFVFISFIGVAIIALALVYYVKKRNNRKHARLHEELFEKYSEPDHRSGSPGPSINGTPMDAFAASGIQYNTDSPRDDHHTPMTTPTISQSSFPVQHPDYYNSAPSRYLAPSQLQASARRSAPTAFPDHSYPHSDSRASYQQSIDSFYGAAGQPLGCNA